MRDKQEIIDSYQKFEKRLVEKNKTMYQVAKGIGIASQTLSAWKNQEYEPNGRTMYKISKYLDVPISYFYD